GHRQSGGRGVRGEDAVQVHGESGKVHDPPRRQRPGRGRHARARQGRARGGGGTGATAQHIADSSRRGSSGPRRDVCRRREARHSLTDRVAADAVAPEARSRISMVSSNSPRLSPPTGTVRNWRRRGPTLSSSRVTSTTGSGGRLLFLPASTLRTV